jgi:hypothetical protein
MRAKARDPRFDELCGTVNERAFAEAYAFIGEQKTEVALPAPDSLAWLPVGSS